MLKCWMPHPEEWNNAFSLIWPVEYVTYLPTPINIFASTLASAHSCHGKDSTTSEMQKLSSTPSQRWRIYIQRHTPQKGMSLILDTVSRMRHSWTHPNWVRWRMRCHRSLPLSAHNPHHRWSPSMPPSSTPTIFPAGPALHTTYRHGNNPCDTKPTRPDASIYKPTPTCSNAGMYNQPVQPWRLESSTSICDPTPMHMAQRLCFEPNTGIYNPTLTFWVECQCVQPASTSITQHWHVQPQYQCVGLCFKPNTGVYSPTPVNGRWRGSGGNPHRHCRGPYHSRGGALSFLMYIASVPVP